MREKWNSTTGTPIRKEGGPEGEVSFLSSRPLGRKRKEGHTCVD